MSQRTPVKGNGALDFPVANRDIRYPRSIDMDSQHLDTIAALKQAKETAEADTRAKSELLATASHEIRTPMTGILSIVELMLEAEPRGRQRQYLEMIRSSADASLKLVDDLLAYAAPESGRIEIAAIDFALRNHLTSLLGTLAIQARKKGLSLVVRVDPDVPDLLVGDPTPLGQVLTNLVANAIKFTPVGTVVVEVSLDTRTEEQLVLEFIVSDTGPGIPVDQHEAIFQPFKQGGATTDPCDVGAGLGLAICKRLVTSMGGQIGVDVQPSLGGSTFRFTCPFAVATPSPDTHAEDPPAAELPLLDFDDAGNAAPTRDQPPATAHRDPDLGPGRALVVEDNHINQVVAKDMIQDWGIAVQVASSGTEALTALDQRAFDLVLIDVRLPDMDGFAVTTAIRAAATPARLLRSGVPAPIPIIAMTANVAAGDRQKCLDAGMDAYVPKPLHKPSLLAAMRTVLITDAQPTPEETAPQATEPRAGNLNMATANTIFDREALLRRVDGRHERAQQLALIFVEEDGPHHRTALSRAFTERDVSAIRDAAHALRGAAGEICAPAMAAAAEQLEAMAQSQDLRRVGKKYETLDQEIETLTEKLKAFCRERACPSGDTHEGHLWWGGPQLPCVGSR